MTLRRSLASLLLLLIPACYTPDMPVCAFRCDDNAMNDGHSHAPARRHRIRISQAGRAPSMGQG